ncbi:MAG: Do family serine endopeptidase [Rhodobacteraceae bacterium]|nr:Do family serine endopeptidase [Paracoccaceae bacterium]
MKTAAVLLAALFCAGTAVADTTVPASQAQITMSFAPVVRLAAPAVVNIFAKRIVQDSASPFSGDPFFDQLFRNYAQSVPRVQSALGSGVILSADGLVVTNYHVVGKASEIRVALQDRREFAADVVLEDQQADLAVLRLKGAHDLPALTLRDSNTVEVGDLVLAIGDPFGVGQTVSSGIVSGLARSLLSLGEGKGYYMQTDAPINPGNSGGALVDMQGQLVGINSAILSQSGGSNGIGFAIPSNMVRAFLKQAMAGATRFTRPWSGITGQAVDASLADSLGLTHPDGVLVSAIDLQSPFAKAGVATGDVILSVEGQAVNSPQELLFRMTTAGIGASASIDYLHAGKTRTAKIAMTAPPETPPRDAVTITQDVVFRGLTVERINPAVIAELSLSPTARGVVVSRAEDLAASVGLQAGDILLSINGDQINGPQDVKEAAQTSTRFWQVDVIRQGQRLRLRFSI